MTIHQEKLELSRWALAFVFSSACTMTAKELAKSMSVSELRTLCRVHGYGGTPSDVVTI